MDAWTELAERVREFDRQEGAQIGSAGYAARLGKILVQELHTRTHALRNTLLEAHADFEAPLGPGVEDKITEWGARALSSTYGGLEGYFIRHLGSYGIGPGYASGLDTEYALGRTAVINGARDHIWTLRKVPVKKPRPSDSAHGGGITITGPVGAVFTAAGASANISQTLSNGETPGLQVALERLAKAIEHSLEVASADKAVWSASIDSALKELAVPEPSTNRLRAILGRLATGVQALGSVKPAWDLVQETIKRVGL